MSVRFVLKRNGRRQIYEHTKLETRLSQLIKTDQLALVDRNRILADVESILSSETETSTLDRLLADTIAKLSILHPVYDVLAAQVELDCIYKATPIKFSESCHRLAAHPNPILTVQFMTDLASNQEYIDIMVAGACTPRYSYSTLKLMKSDMLLRKNGELIERPEYAFMRVAIALHGSGAVRVMATFEQLLHGYYIHSPATMAQAGTTSGTLTSSHMIHLSSTTSTVSAFNALHQTAVISSAGGAIGINFNSVPCTGADMGGVPSLGLPPLLDLWNAAASASVSDLNGTAAGIAAYLQPWHGDVYSVLETIQAQGLSKRLHYGLSIPNIFMLRAEKHLKWSLFCPKDVPLLENSIGVAFDAAYFAAEMDPRIPRTTIPARSLLSAIVRCQLETGEPMILYRDSANLKSNQSNMGMTSHGDAFGAITQCTSPSETATTSEAALVLPAFVRFGQFDYNELRQMSHSLTINLNQVIDVSKSPTTEASNGSRRQRAIAIGMQGLGEVFLKMKLPYTSPEAKDVAYRIVQTIYYGSASASVEFARDHGAYEQFGGSPLSRGELIFNLFGQPQDDRFFNWSTLRRDMATYGTANSVFTALMPMDAMLNVAALDSSFGPINSVLQKHGSFASSYNMINPILVEWLTATDKWTEAIRVQIARGKGSISQIKQIPREIRDVFKTSWELGPEAVVDMAITTAPFICQAQSLELHLQNPSVDRVMDIHFKSWSAGLKAGLYTLKTRDESTAYVVPLAVSPAVLCAPPAAPAPTCIPPILVLSTTEADNSLDNNQSDSDFSDFYATEDEDADGEYDEDADVEDADIEDVEDEATDAGNEVDELMFDPLEFIDVDRTDY